MKHKLILGICALLTIITATSCRMHKGKRAYMHQTFKMIKRSLKNAEVSSLNDSVKVLFPSNLMFPFNSSSIDTNIMPSISKLSEILNKYNKTAIMVSGYTDSVGTDEYNDALSAKRADITKEALIQNKVNPVRVNTWGMGKRHPIAGNDTEEGRSRNRRVEFVILYSETKK